MYNILDDSQITYTLTSNIVDYDLIGSELVLREADIDIFNVETQKSKNQGNGSFRGNVILNGSGIDAVVTLIEVSSNEIIQIVDTIAGAFSFEFIDETKLYDIIAKDKNSLYEKKIVSSLSPLPNSTFKIEIYDIIKPTYNVLSGMTTTITTKAFGGFAPYTYSLLDAPSYINIDALTGVVTIEVPSSTSDNFVIPFTVAVVDALDNSKDRLFSITVNKG